MAYRANPAPGSTAAGVAAPGLAARGPWERKRVRASLEIERAGLELLARRGLDDVTVEQVAAAAGISIRTFFRYFRNVPDLLSGPPQREAARICRVVASRPGVEGLLDSFRVAFGGQDDTWAGLENGDLERTNHDLWSAVARADPERVGVLSQGLTAMTAAFTQTTFTETMAGRLPGGGDGTTAGVLGAALAGVVWFVYLRSVESADAPPLADLLDRALGALAQHLF